MKKIFWVLALSIIAVSLLVSSGVSAFVQVARGRRDVVESKVIVLPRPQEQGTAPALSEDLSWTPAAAPWNWQVVGSQYTVRVKENVTAAQVLEFSKGGQSVYLQPMALEWTNNLSQIQTISMPVNSGVIVSSPNGQGRVIWPSSYGSGISLEWDVTPDRLLEVLTINNLSAIPLPAQYIISGGSPSLRYNFILSTSSGVNISVNGTLWDKKTEVQTLDYAEFCDAISGNVLWGFAPPIYYDSDGSVGKSTTTLRKSGNSLYVSIVVPYSWVQAAVYPIYIDPTIDAGVKAEGRYLYVGHWQWVTEGAWVFCWRMPRVDIGLGLLDLRSIPQMSKAGGEPEGYGLFVLGFRDDSTGYYLGNGLGSKPVPHIRDVLRSILGLSQSLSSNTSLDILWELLTLRADPTGQLRWKPLMPEIDGKLKLYLGGFSLVREESYNPTQHPLVLELLREDYRRLRQEFQSVGSDHYRKVLSAWQDKYGKFGLTWEDFIPADLPKEKPLLHSTTITESFNKADDGLGPDLTWTAVAGTWGVTSNQADYRSTQAVGYARAESDLATDDHYAQAVVTHSGGVSASAWPGVCTRLSTVANTYYRALIYEYDDKLYIEKLVAGTGTTLGSVAITMSWPCTLKCQADGSTIKGFQNAVEKLSVTDTAITAIVRTGIVGYQWADYNIRWDNFEAGDLAAPPTYQPRPGVGVGPSGFIY